MKIKEGFVLRKLQGMNVVMPSGENIKDYKKAVVLNDTAVFIYEKLAQKETGEKIVKAMIFEYDIDRDKAEAAVGGTIRDLSEAGIMEE